MSSQSYSQRYEAREKRKAETLLTESARELQQAEQSLAESARELQQAKQSLAERDRELQQAKQSLAERDRELQQTKQLLDVEQNRHLLCMGVLRAAREVFAQELRAAREVIAQDNIELRQTKGQLAGTQRMLEQQNVELQELRVRLADLQVRKLSKAKQNAELQRSNTMLIDLQARKFSADLELVKSKTELEVATLCAICSERQRNCILLPCLHSTYCTQCIASLPQSRCPLCRCDITSSQNFYF